MTDPTFPPLLTDERIRAITGCSDEYLATSKLFILAIARAIEAEVRQAEPVAINMHESMFSAAVKSIAEISRALGIPEDEAACANGNELILDAIEALRTPGMTFDQWQAKHGPNGGAYDIEQQRAGWDGAMSARTVTDNQPNCEHLSRWGASGLKCAGCSNATQPEPVAWAAEFRDCVLNQRFQLAENGMTSDQINDVLNLFDDLYKPPQPAQPPKGRVMVPTDLLKQALRAIEDEYEYDAERYPFNTRLIDELRAALAAAPQPAQPPAGWKLVPTEPTPKMLAELFRGYVTREDAYKAMLAAAPAAPAGGDHHG